MKTLDLSVVQRGLRDQLEAGEELLDAIEALTKLAAELEGTQRDQAMAIVRQLTSASLRMINKAGQTSADIRQFLTR
jgi:hypothetical protein